MTRSDHNSEPADLSGLRIARIATVPMFFSTHLKDQLPAIGEAGAEIDVICSDGPQLKDIAWSPRLRSVTIEIPRSISPFADAKALVALWRQFRKGRYDIIHSTTPKAGLLSALAGWLARVPVRIHTFTGQPWVTLKGPKAWVAKASDRLIGRLSTRCFTDSNSQRQFLIDQGILKADKVTVLGEGSVAGVDTARFDLANFPKTEREEARRALGIDPGDLVFLFLGRICRDKGIFELFQALSDLRAQGYDPKLVLAGPIESSADDPVPLSAKSLEASGVIHLDFTSEPERYIALSDCLVLPSYREGFGSVVIEAAAMGRPAIGTDIYGLSDAIVNEETGILVPPQAVATLAAAMRKLIENPQMRADLGQSARDRARALFTSEALNEAVIADYAKAVRSRRSVP